MKLIVDEPKAAGRALDLGTVNVVIYINLGPDYSEIVEAMSIWGGGPISFTELSNVLIDHETRINHTNAADLTLASTNPNLEANYTAATRGNHGMKRRCGTHEISEVEVLHMSNLRDKRSLVV